MSSTCSNSLLNILFSTEVFCKKVALKKNSELQLWVYIQGSIHFRTEVPLVIEILLLEFMQKMITQARYQQEGCLSIWKI